MAAEAGEDVWGDEDFLNALIVATETASAAVSSSSSSSFRPSSLPPLPLPPPPRPVRVAPKPPPPVSLSNDRSQVSWQEWDDFFANGNLDLFDVAVDARVCDFSPPRELSQREKKSDPSSGVKRVLADKDKDKEIERLKKEMEKISKKLNRMEREHGELQEDRGKKEKELQRAISEILARNAEIEGLKKEIFDGLPAPERLCPASDESNFPLRIPSPEFAEGCIRMEKTNNPGKTSFVSEPQACVVSTGQVEVISPKERIIQSGYHQEENVKMQHTKAIGVQTELNDSDPATREWDQIHKFSHKMSSLWGSDAERKWGRYFYSRLLGCCSLDLFTLFRFIGAPSNVNSDFLCEKKFIDADWDDLKCPGRSVEVQKVTNLYSILMKIRKEILRLDDLVEALMELCALGNMVITYRSLRILHAACRIICLNQSVRRDNCLIEPSFCGTLPELEDLTRPSGNLSRSYLSLNRQFLLMENMCGIILSNKKTSVMVEAISIMNLILENSHPFLERDKLGLIPSLACVSHLFTREVDPCAKRPESLEDIL
ncbi:protein dimerization isoform X2 [Wolffia australiana]